MVPDQLLRELSAWASRPAQVPFPQAPSDQLAQAVAALPSFVHDEVACHAGLNAADVAALAQLNLVDVDRALLSRTDLTTPVLKVLAARHLNGPLNSQVCWRDDLDEEVLELLATSSLPAVRLEVASSRRAPSKVLHQLLSDPSPQVAHAALSNRNLDLQDFAYLSAGLLDGQVLPDESELPRRARQISPSACFMSSDQAPAPSAARPPGPAPRIPPGP